MAPPLLYAVLSMAGLWAGLRWFERVNLYAPDRVLTIIPNTYGIPFEDAWPEASDGARLHGWWVDGRPGESVVLFFHGNAGNISSRVEKLRILHGLGLSVLLFDYRGYGRSRGRPSERGLYRDAEAAYDWLVRGRRIDPRRIVFFGESLGCAVATELATRHDPRALILESPFTSTVEMGRLAFPFLPVRWLVRHRYDSLAKIPRVRSPVLVMHSPEDEIVPYAMARRLFDAAAAPKSFADLRGDHNEGFLLSGPLYPGALRSFLDSLASR